MFENIISVFPAHLRSIFLLFLEETCSDIVKSGIHENLINVMTENLNDEVCYYSYYTLLNISMFLTLLIYSIF